MRNALHDSLGKLIILQRAERGSSSKPPELDLMDHVARAFPVATESLLGRYLKANPDRGDVSDWNIYLHLQLVRKGGLMLPVLTFSYDFPREILRLRVGLFALRDSDGPRSPRAVGYRFETPESRTGSGDGQSTGLGHHDYFHAQPIARLVQGKPKTQLPDSDRRWIPVAQPAFPLEAQNLLQLFACMLITIYGRKYVAGADFAEVRRPLGTSIHDLKCLQSE